MEIYALDKDFNMIANGIPYDNLQWTRRYYEPGEFMVEIPLSLYDPAWAYIGTNDRPELGMVQKLQFMGEGDVMALISGFFCEQMLNNKVCFPRFIGKYDSTEYAMADLFATYGFDLPIEFGGTNNPPIGGRTECDFSDEALGDKLYSMFEIREASIRVEYDFIENKLRLKAWEGVDRTQSQKINTFQTFSSEFGNIVDKSIETDDSGYKNYAYIPVNADDDGKEQDVLYLDQTNGEERREVVFDMRSSKPDEKQSAADFKAAILQEAREKLQSYAKVEEINVEQANDAGYMIDYDLGDKCDVILNDVGIKMETRIVEVDEVFKPEGGHSVTLGMGNKRIDNIRRAVNSK